MTSKLPNYFVIAKEGGPSSVSWHTTAVVRGLAEGGYPVTVLTTRADVIDQAVRDLPVVCVHQALSEEGSFRGLYREWSSALGRFKADRAILIRGYAGTTPLAVGLAIRRRFKRVYAIEHAPPDLLKALNPGTSYIRRGGPAGRVRDGLTSGVLYRSITVSDAVRRWLIERYHFNPEKVRTCLSWTDTERFRPDEAKRRQTRGRLGAADDEWVIGYIGRLSPEKRIDLIIRGFARFARDFPGRTRLVIVGCGPEEQMLRGLVAELGVGARVQFMGLSAEPENWHRAVDVELLTSQQEGFPLSILEAMACGAVVLVAPVGGMPATVTDGVNGFIEPLDDPGVIAERLRGITALPPGCVAAIRAEARETIARDFNASVGLGRILTALDAPAAARLCRAPAAVPEPVGASF